MKISVVKHIVKFKKPRWYNNIWVVTLLLFSSCIDKTMKDYNYIETCMLTNYDTTLPKELKPLLIKAKSDSDAYLQAYLNFCLAKKYYSKEFQKSGAKAGQPLSFRLLDKDSVNIAQSIIFLNRKKLEMNIEKRVALFELKKDKEN